MSDKVEKMIAINCNDEEEAKRVGEKIHQQLVGNPDYVNGDILLHVEEKEVELYRFESNMRNRQEIKITI